MNNTELVALISDLAQEIDKEDPIDFGMLEVDEDALWPMMAANVVEMFKFESVNDKLVMLATVTKLVVENFTLKAQMMQCADDNK